jgi:hypothetical protein
VTITITYGLLLKSWFATSCQGFRCKTEKISGDRSALAVGIRDLGLRKIEVMVKIPRMRLGSWLIAFEQSNASSLGIMGVPRTPLSHMRGSLENKYPVFLDRYLPLVVVGDPQSPLWGYDTSVLSALETTQRRLNICTDSSVLSQWLSPGRKMFELIPVIDPASCQSGIPFDLVAPASSSADGRSRQRKTVRGMRC